MEWVLFAAHALTRLFVRSFASCSHAHPLSSFLLEHRRLTFDPPFFSCLSTTKIYWGMATLPSSSSGARAERGLLHALIKAAAAADDQALLPLLPSATDADLNAVDEVGRTVLGAAIAGNRCVHVSCQMRT